MHGNASDCGTHRETPFELRPPHLPGYEEFVGLSEKRPSQCGMMRRSNADESPAQAARSVASSPVISGDLIVPVFLSS